jgi:mannose-6-phosphate isomerase
MSPVEVRGVPRDYPWGSYTAIQRLAGLPEDGRPLAELWFGEDLALPFLLKLLAAHKALSIQVHPNREQAGAGFAREDAAGIPRDAPERNYRDDNHKPELLCALTPFEALCGFRPVAETLAVLDALGIPALGFVADALRGPDPLRAAFTAILTGDESRAALPGLSDRAHAEPDGPLRPVHLAATDFPGDPGALLALLLNYVRLEPGEAVYLGAGNVHAYLRGMGVEIMAHSDNVLRCGLTPKHVDVPELLRIADFRELPEPRWPATRDVFEVPVPDFRLVRITVEEPVALDDPGPCLALCTSGAVVVGDVALRPGRAAFVPAGEPTRVAGAGELFVAAVGELSARSGR